MGNLSDSISHCTAIVLVFRFPHFLKYCSNNLWNASVRFADLGRLRVRQHSQDDRHPTTWTNQGSGKRLKLNLGIYRVDSF
ncbi:hypothetical protein V1524DRAFT_443984 [Lipomyces starkeyi]